MIHPFDVTMERPHHADAREHRRAILFRHQRFHRGLPFVGCSPSAIW
jgi:hypothetical protein